MQRREPLGYVITFFNFTVPFADINFYKVSLSALVLGRQQSSGRLGGVLRCSYIYIYRHVDVHTHTYIYVLMQSL